MKHLPDDLRVQLANLRVCRANGISPRVLVPEAALDWLAGAEEDGVIVDPADDIRTRAVGFARQLIGSRYETLADLQRAPRVFSCSSFVKFVFASVGVWMPRYAVDQSYQGVTLDGPRWTDGTLLFWKSLYPIEDETRAVGHVAVVSGEGRAIHAGGRARTVHAFSPSRPASAIFVDPFPSDPQALLLLPSEERGFETALDVVRFLQR